VLQLLFRIIASDASYKSCNRCQSLDNFFVEDVTARFEPKWTRGSCDVHPELLRVVRFHPNLGYAVFNVYSVRWDGLPQCKPPLLVVPAKVRYSTIWSNPRESVLHWLLGERSTFGKKQTPGSIRLLSPTYFYEILMFFLPYGFVSNS
jgi:hypothetical protein